MALALSLVAALFLLEYLRFTGGLTHKRRRAMTVLLVALALPFFTLLAAEVLSFLE